jgi:3-methyladenine DNA glycosylase AlkD
LPRVPTAAALADELEARIAAHGDPERAINERRYLKSDLEFHGAGLPAVNAEVRAFAREHALDRRRLLAVIRALWARPVHERHMAAVALLERLTPLLESADLALLEQLIRTSYTWAYVDALAVNVVGALVAHDAELGTTLDRWAQDKDFWIRRSAMLALLGPLRRGGGDFERFARYADAMLEEREFFIRKAIGWVLRDTSKRRPDLVYEWILPRAVRASGVTVREAVKYLSPEQRVAVMAAYEARAKTSKP